MQSQATTTWSTWFNSRHYGLPLLFIILSVLISLLTRSLLLILNLRNADAGLHSLTSIYSIGLVYDLAAASYLALPFTLYLLLAPRRLLASQLQQRAVAVACYLGIYALLFIAAAELIFWDEFSTRFNFIAVDYLVYTSVVVGNIRQSYPVIPILGALLLLTLGLGWQLRAVIHYVDRKPAGMRRRATGALPLLLAPLLAYVLLDGGMAGHLRNNYQSELAGNGIYSFFAAFNSNELDYAGFYRTLDSQRLWPLLQDQVDDTTATFTPVGITRNIKHAGRERRWNVVLITVESLSADYLGSFGNPEGLTPNLDMLAKKSLLFTQFYATGTRTDRGLESITLAVPPSPGRSMIKRPNNENLFSIGFLFQERGYDTRFIYGGYGYFDNMNHFFANNGFEVVDRTQMKTGQIQFENIWGVSDEDLFRNTLKLLDDSHARGKPSFSLVMTTSNHRPYTYPDGRIDIPSHTSRQGAVKYTDYAIGKFLRDAESRPWFDNTLFVIVADHHARSAGKMELPFDRYQIPLFFYAPKLIKPDRQETMTSQIDLAPTLCGLLNFSYTSKFFGHDVLDDIPDRPRALIANYQKLGLLTPGELTVLAPRGEARSYAVDISTGKSQSINLDETAEANAIAYYQGAYELLHHGGYRHQP